MSVLFSCQLVGWPLILIWVLKMKTSTKKLRDSGIKPVQSLSTQTRKALAHANNNGSGGHCQGGGDGNW